jgi:NIMA (never in mitosis gene a)-related kinase
MSTKVLSGQKYSFPADVWSLGIIFYDLMIFRIQFTGDLQQFSKQIESVDLQPIADEYSNELKHLQSDMLIKDYLWRIKLSDILKLSLIEKIESNVSSFLPIPEDKVLNFVLCKLKKP